MSSHRILLIDADPNDRALATLALASRLVTADPQPVATLPDMVAQLAQGTVAGVVVDGLAPMADEMLACVRRVAPAAFVVGFAAASTPALAGCDVQLVKDSAGYLRLAGLFEERFALEAELARLPALADLSRLAVLPLPLALAVDGQLVMALNGAFLDATAMDAAQLAGLAVADLEARSGGALAQTPCGTLRDGRAVTLVQSLAAAPSSPPASAPDETLDTLLSALAHDVQQPAQRLKRNAEALTRTLAGTDAVADAEALTQDAERVLAMMQGILEFGRSGALSRRPVPLDELLAQVLGDLKPAIEQAAATVEVGPLPTVMGDPIQLGRIFANLLGNALKYRGDSLPRIRVGTLPADAGLTIFVEDNGPGMPPELAEAAFDLFRRLDPNGPVPGTGLGLAICRRIARAHGGELSVSTSPGRGCRFELFLPA